MARRALNRTVCTKCERNSPVQGQAWCAGCFAAYQKSYAQTKLAQAEGQGFSAGVEAMRETLAMEFQRLGFANVSCAEVAGAIRRAPRPILRISES